MQIHIWKLKMNNFMNYFCIKLVSDLQWNVPSQHPQLIPKVLQNHGYKPVQSLNQLPKSEHHMWSLHFINIYLQ